MEHDTVTLQTQEVYKVIATLKKIKPRGFDSMDRVVGLVMFFQNKLNTPPDGGENEVE